VVFGASHRARTSAATRAVTGTLFCDCVPRSMRFQRTTTPSIYCRRMVAVMAEVDHRNSRRGAASSLLLLVIVWSLQLAMLMPLPVTAVVTVGVAIYLVRGFRRTHSTL